MASSNFLKFGSADINTGSGIQQIISSKAGDNIFIANAEIMQIVSADLNDNISGSGARKIKLQGLDENYNLQSEIIELNGINIVETNKKYIRIFRANVTEVGSNNFDINNIGNISFTPKITNLEMLRINANEGQTLTTQFTIPSGFKASLINVFFDTSIGRSVRIRLKIRPFGNNKPTLTKSTFEVYQNGLNVIYDDPVKLSEKDDIWFTAESTQPGGAIVSLKYFLRLEKLN